MLEGFRPLLAATIESEEDLTKMTFPMYGSPKLDGIRCITHPELGPVSRSLKPIPNKWIREVLKGSSYKNLDGELIVGQHHGEGVFARSTSGVMSFAGEPQFAYCVFDDITHISDGFAQRLEFLGERDFTRYEGSFATIVPQQLLTNIDQAIEAEARCVERGYEGLMLRKQHGKYKYGRSTFKEQILMKMKRFVDEEAIVIGYELLERNTNEKLLDNLGLAKRSSVSANYVVDDRYIGKLNVRSEKWGEFNVGSGFDMATRADIRDNWPRDLGRQITFKYQPVGVVDKPRIPIFKGFRPKE